MRKIEYNLTERDVLGNVLSIDNLVIEWKYTGPEKTLRKELLDLFSETVPKWDFFHDCRLDAPTAQKYSWFRNSVWGDGVFVRWDKFRTLTKAVETVPIVQLEVNPNKHWNKPVMVALRELLERRCVEGNLRKYDFAVDVPARIEHVNVSSRKKQATVKGTQYYGTRNKHGHLRVYDKKSEMVGRGNEVDSDELTRLEWTFVDGEKIVFDEVGIRFFDTFHSGYGELSNNAKMVADLASMLMENGVEWAEIAPFLNRSTRKKIEPAVSGAHIRLCVGSSAVYSLVDKYACELNIAYRDDSGKWISHWPEGMSHKPTYPVAR